MCEMLLEAFHILDIILTGVSTVLTPLVMPLNKFIFGMSMK
jgi:hypothetical protein